jgi:hypothetical protein
MLEAKSPNPIPKGDPMLGSIWAGSKSHGRADARNLRSISPRAMSTITLRLRKRG